ncbi:hypothetical protein ACJ72_05723, partial [Emergomyces africanus]
MQFWLESNLSNSLQCATTSQTSISIAPAGTQQTISSVFRQMDLAGPDATGAPMKDLSWLSANVASANARIRPSFGSLNYPPLFAGPVKDYYSACSLIAENRHL